MKKKIVFLPYDMDTAIGINNEGSLVFSYNLEDIDQTVRGKLHFVIAKEIGTVLETALNPAEKKAEALNIPPEPPRTREAALCQ